MTKNSLYTSRVTEHEMNEVNRIISVIAEGNYKCGEIPNDGPYKDWAFAYIKVNISAAAMADTMNRIVGRKDFLFKASEKGNNDQLAVISPSKDRMIEVAKEISKPAEKKPASEVEEEKPEDLAEMLEAASEPESDKGEENGGIGLAEAKELAASGGVSEMLKGMQRKPSRAEKKRDEKGGGKSTNKKSESKTAKPEGVKPEKNKVRRRPAATSDRDRTATVGLIRSIGQNAIASPVKEGDDGRVYAVVDIPEHVTMTRISEALQSVGGGLCYSIKGNQVTFYAEDDRSLSDQLLRLYSFSPDNANRADGDSQEGQPSSKGR